MLKYPPTKRTISTTRRQRIRTKFTGRYQSAVPYTVPLSNGQFSVVHRWKTRENRHGVDVCAAKNTLSAYVRSVGRSRQPLATPPPIGVRHERWRHGDGTRTRTEFGVRLGAHSILLCVWRSVVACVRFSRVWAFYFWTTAEGEADAPGGAAGGRGAHTASGRGLIFDLW